MRRRLLTSVLLFSSAVGAVVVTPALAHPNVESAAVISPAAALSTSGDYATDVLGDPWDFSNDEDVPPIAVVGSESSFPGKAFIYVGTSAATYVRSEVSQPCTATRTAPSGRVASTLAESSTVGA